MLRELEETRYLRAASLGKQKKKKKKNTVCERGENVLVRLVFEYHAVRRSVITGIERKLS